MGKPRCLETRSRHGMRFRRYRRDDDSEFTTYELPIKEFEKLILAGNEDTHRQWFNAMNQKVQHQIVESYVRGGWKLDAIALRLQIPLHVVHDMKVAIDAKYYSRNNPKDTQRR